MSFKKELENEFTMAVYEQFGCVYPFYGNDIIGTPNLIVVIPGCPVGFVEIRDPRKKVRPCQLTGSVMRMLSSKGANCFVLDDFDHIDLVINAIMNG